MRCRTRCTSSATHSAVGRDGFRNRSLARSGLVLPWVARSFRTSLFKKRWLAYNTLMVERLSQFHRIIAACEHGVDPVVPLSTMCGLHEQPQSSPCTLRAPSVVATHKDQARVATAGVNVSCLRENIK